MPSPARGIRESAPTSPEGGEALAGHLRTGTPLD